MIRVMGPVRASISGRCLRWLVGITDTVLRRIRGVTEFESAREGILRIELGHAERDIRLSDSTRLDPGDMVIELHLWNEQLLHVPLTGVNFGWAVRIRRQALSSLRRLALYIQQDRGLDDVRAIRMKPALASRRPSSALSRLLLKIGFEPVTAAAPAHGSLLGFLDNLWLWLLTWAHNPLTLKGRRFSRTRREFWISRERFLALYADGPAVPANAERRTGSTGGTKSAVIGGRPASD